MNRRGFYTALVGLIALAVVVGSLFYARAPLNEDRAEYTLKAADETRLAWQNARYLYDKAAAEAIADYLYDGVTLPGCAWDLSNVEERISQYFTNMEQDIGNNTNFTCVADLPAFSASGGAVSFSFPLRCTEMVSSAAGTGEVWIEKNVTIDKTAAVSGMDSCTITIRDNQSGEVELTMTKSAS